ncbi:MAG: LysR family transcriptional regulator [Pseudomonadota bacterium]
MDFQNLRAFIKVAETASFSHAAQELHLTQPAVSKRVALLEEELGAQLFDRIGRKVGLTEAGRALLPHARAVEQQLADAAQSVRDLAGDVAGNLRLATSHHIGLHRLPPVLSRFSRDYPAVHLDIDFMDSEQAYDQILQGKAELAVVTLAPDQEPSIIAREIWRDPLDILVAKDHDMAKRKTVTLDLLADHAAILPGLNTYTGQIVKRLFDQRGLTLQVSMVTNYLETIRMMASVGLGWTVLPSSMRDSSLAAVALEGLTMERTLGCIHHRGRSLSRAAQAFTQSLDAFAD